MRSDRDPFDGVRLDDHFVRAARFIEPSAAERARAGDARRPSRWQVSPAHRGPLGAFYRLVRFIRFRLRRRVKVLAALALALGMLSLGVLVFRLNAGRGGASGGGANPAAGPAIEVTATSSGRETVPSEAFGPVVLSASDARVVVPGNCLTWVPVGSGSVMTNKVACWELHRGEVTKIIDLTDQFPVWPGQNNLRSLAAQVCPAARPDHLNAGPRGKAFVPKVESVHVAQEDWEDDVRVLVCLVGNQQGTPWSDPAPPAGAAA